LNAIVKHFLGNVDEAEVGEDFVVVVKYDGGMLGKTKLKKLTIAGITTNKRSFKSTILLRWLTNNENLGNS
jgi:hypothetical protein